MHLRENVNHGATKKSIIYEEKSNEGASDLGDEDQFGSQSMKEANMTWEDMMDENMELKS